MEKHGLLIYPAKKNEAVEILKKANQKNPYCVSIRKYLEKWSSGRFEPLKSVNIQCYHQIWSQLSEVEDYTQYEYDAFGYDEDIGIDFEQYLDKYGYL